MTLEILRHRAAKREGGAPLLFVHGAYLAAWCWEEHFLPWFADHGYDAYALSVRGHGASPCSGTFDLAGIDDYVQDVLEAAAGLPEPPVLIGHSMGAIVVQRAATRVRARGLVLLAPVPPHGLAGSLFTLATRDPPLFAALNAMQIASGGDASGVMRVRDYLFSQTVTEHDARRYLLRMQRESARALADLAWPQQMWLAPSVGLPTLVIGAGRDAFFSRAMTMEAASFHGVAPVMFDEMAHVMMLEPGWQTVAEAIYSWLERTIDRPRKPSGAPKT